MISWIVMCLMGMLIFHRAATLRAGTGIQPANSHQEYAQGRDAYERSPWDAFPDYYL